MRWKQYLAAAFRLLKSDQFTTFVTATALGCGLALGLSVALGTVGLPWAVSLGLLLATAIGADVGWRLNGTIGARGGVCAKVGFVAWIFVAPAVAQTALTWFGTMAGEFASTNQGSFAAGTLIGTLVLGMPCCLAICALFNGSESRFPGLGTIGMSLGLIGTAMVPVAFVGTQLLALIAAVTVAVLETLRMAVPNAEQPLADVPPVPKSTRGEVLLSYAVITLCGAAVTVVARVMNQTMPASSQVLMWSLATLVTSVILGLCVGTGGSGLWGRVRSFVCRLCSQPVAVAATGLAVMSVFVLFPSVVRAQLTLNAQVSYPRFLLSVRGLLVGVFLFPIGLAVGSSLRKVRASQATLASPALVFGVGAVVAMALITQLGTPMLGVGLVGVLTIAFWFSLRSTEGRWVPASRSSRVAAILALVAAVGLPLGVGQFHAASASQLLFSSAVFREFAAGTDADLLLSTNDGRLLSSEEHADGLTSTWRFAGSRVQVRRNGIPVGMTSTQVLTCPQPSMATLPVVLPLLMHASPAHVLFLGDTGAAAEATSLMFPIQSLTAIDGSERTVAATDQHYAARKQDDRFSKIDANPVVAISGLKSRYDVIVCRPPQAALLEATPYYTAEFHRRAARCLTDDGFFCQTFSQVDFGADPLRRLLKSVSYAFKHVTAMPLEGGELLVVATNGETIIRPGLAKRASFGHVRRILDDLGWDWSRVLGIASIDSKSVDAILADYHQDNTLSNAAFLWDLPVETMRWGDKGSEIRIHVAGYQRRILDQLEQDDFRDEAARLLSELGQEADLLFGFPDEPWMYRKTLRTRLEQNPRPPLEVVANNEVQRQAHPVDTYRIDYFKALANAAQSARVGLGGFSWKDQVALMLARAELDKLEQFTSPTEPLVSYFASHELVRIHVALGGSPAREFEHRLHTIYFVPGMTRSVREVVAAMNLLVAHPEIIADPADRWDQMNSLLQVLMGRWSARRDIPPRSSRVALNDIQKTLQAIDAGLAAMNEWSVEANIDETVCDNREMFLRRRLERPLRRYRGELLPHHYKAGSDQLVEDDAVDQFRTLGN